MEESPDFDIHTRFSTDLLTGYFFMQMNGKHKNLLKSQF